MLKSNNIYLSYLLKISSLKFKFCYSLFITVLTSLCNIIQNNKIEIIIKVMINFKNVIFFAVIFFTSKIHLVCSFFKRKINI